jgi:hypothetical protein
MFMFQFQVQYPNQEDRNEFSPDRGLAMSTSPPTSPNRPSSSSFNTSSDTKSPSVLNQLDGEDLLQRNNSICSQAIQRAVNDASNGNLNKSFL